METINAIAQFYYDYPAIRAGLAPFTMCLIVYVFVTKTAFGRHAIQNISASFWVGLMNVGFGIYFFREITGFIQGGYDMFHVPTLPSDFWSAVPFPLVVLIAIVSKDFVDYWNHRAMHMKWLWPTHAAHHSDTHVNAFTTYRVHAFESIVMSASYIFLLTWLQMPAAVPVVLALSSIHNMYTHMDLPFTHGRFHYLLASPVFHRWHHADVPAAYGKNLANHIPLWDKLFGTYYCPGLCQEEMGALKTGVEDKNPILIYIYPLQEWARMARALWARPKDQQDQKVTGSQAMPAPQQSEQIDPKMSPALR